ncbi:hypothetical protein ARGLB_085_00480 [Arthrobacter globiformis NBRC 12137]|uniref:Uncharacterized protein n=1 Tax=Arthrobacter globiformis (strain ATCC 8010 / DSM 20124 / JCM 1332 / NBRC 12137 / NCIMB 8907 / NRRL B-2979 / 168) TaxID=1077972 RepID=H0QRM9_ARTG1|nr:hypothetical protein ARGLB_085_00480 [Arthrobacter globiformis NBRC 12137]
MEGSGNSALTGAAPRGGVLQAAAFPDAEFLFDAFPDGAILFDEFPDDGLPYDDDLDAAFPALFPEDPFPEAQFADVLFADAAASIAGTGAGGRGPGTPRPALADRVASAAALLRADLNADKAGLIDQTHAYENIKSMLAGQQARLAVAFETRHHQDQTDLGTDEGRRTLTAENLGKDRSKDRGLGAAEQIALGRGESPNRGGRLLGMAKALVTEMPHTLAALDTGQLNEERTTHIVKETACLSPADRTAVDEELAADTGTFTGAGTRTLIAATRAAATRRDPRSVTQRASHAASERTVSLRPAPDTMTYLTALLPAHQGVAVYAALTRHADTLKAAGDPRSRNQAMADTLVERTTGTPGGITGIDISLVMTDRTLLQADTEPARLAGYGAVPAQWARELLTGGQGDQGPVQPTAGGSATGQKGAVKELKTWVRRLYTAPNTGDLVAMESRRRLFPAPLRRFIQIRDDTCRTPYCDAPHPPPRPHHPPAQQRPHHPGQRRRALRGLQPHQRTTRLESPTQTRAAAHHRTHHTHSPHLPLHRTATTRNWLAELVGGTGVRQPGVAGTDRRGVSQPGTGATSRCGCRPRPPARTPRSRRRAGQPAAFRRWRPAAPGPGCVRRWRN